MSQPYLHDQSIVLQAPIQCWSQRDGQLVLPDDATRSHAQGVFCGDDRTVSQLVLRVDDHELEHVGTTEPGGSAARYDYVVRTPDLGVDPQVTIERLRTVRGDGLDEVLVLRSASEREQAFTVLLDLMPDATPMADIKSGLAPTHVTPETPSPGRASWHWRDADTTIELAAPDADIRVVPGEDGGYYQLRWQVLVPARGQVRLSMTLSMADASAPFVATTADPLTAPDVQAAEPALRGLVEKSFRDLNSLRMADRAVPGRPFLAAGAPWFFTLFGRDSLIAARLLLPTNVDLAASTLEVLAARQGTRTDVENAEQPGKILHEVRRVELQLHDTHTAADGVHDADHALVLPPEYYGTIDATPLWILLFAEAVAAGMDPDRARALVPALEAALGWLRDHADADGDGFLEYFDRSGHGLANQGWKDSGDSIRWADGSQAQGPIALVEVQGYAYAALVAGASLLEQFGSPQASGDWLERAAALKARFREQFWVSDELGRYPALALDAAKRPVDGVSSNMGHLLGTGIVDADEAADIVTRLMHPSMCSGYGMRTLSTTNAGYWPLGYHVGSVWTHDTAVIIDGMLREGYPDAARELAAQLLRASEGFAHRMPELYSGTPASEVFPPLAYPAACRPQAWAAASTVPVARALHPDCF